MPLNSVFHADSNFPWSRMTSSAASSNPLVCCARIRVNDDCTGGGVMLEEPGRDGAGAEIGAGVGAAAVAAGVTEPRSGGEGAAVHATAASSVAEARVSA